MFDEPAKNAFTDKLADFIASDKNSIDDEEWIALREYTLSHLTQVTKDLQQNELGAKLQGLAKQLCSVAAGIVIAENPDDLNREAVYIKVAKLLMVASEKSLSSQLAHPHEIHDLEFNFIKYLMVEIVDEAIKYSRTLPSVMRPTLYKSMIGLCVEDYYLAMIKAESSVTQVSSEAATLSQNSKKEILEKRMQLSQDLGVAILKDLISHAFLCHEEHKQGEAETKYEVLGHFISMHRTFLGSHYLSLLSAYLEMVANSNNSKYIKDLPNYIFGEVAFLEKDQAAFLLSALLAILMKDGSTKHLSVAARLIALHHVILPRKIYSLPLEEIELLTNDPRKLSSYLLFLNNLPRSVFAEYVRSYTRDELQTSAMSVLRADNNTSKVVNDFFQQFDFFKAAFRVTAAFNLKGPLSLKTKSKNKNLFPPVDVDVQGSASSISLDYLGYASKEVACPVYGIKFESWCRQNYPEGWQSMYGAFSKLRHMDLIKTIKFNDDCHELRSGEPFVIYLQLPISDTNANEIVVVLAGDGKRLCYINRCEDPSLMPFKGVQVFECSPSVEMDMSGLSSVPHVRALETILINDLSTEVLRPYDSHPQLPMDGTSNSGWVAAKSSYLASVYLTLLNEMDPENKSMAMSGAIQATKQLSSHMRAKSLLDFEGALDDIKFEVSGIKEELKLKSSRQSVKTRLLSDVDVVVSHGSIFHSLSNAICLPPVRRICQYILRALLENKLVTVDHWLKILVKIQEHKFNPSERGLYLDERWVKLDPSNRMLEKIDFTDLNWTALLDKSLTPLTHNEFTLIQSIFSSLNILSVSMVSEESMEEYYQRAFNAIKGHSSGLIDEEKISELLKILGSETQLSGAKRARCYT